MAELRFNPLLGTWTMVASHRQNRPQMPKNWCPFCPGSGKVPEHYDVHKYNNDFPALSANPPEPDPVGSDFYQTNPSYGACEVILYSPEHTKSLYELSIPHIKKLVDLWAERNEALAKDPKHKYIMPFENRGEEIGVTMPHPHGQIYAYSWIPQKLQVEFDNAKKHYKKTNECIICRMNQEEAQFSERIIFENASFYAYIPFFTDYPYGVFISAKNHRNYIHDLNEQERTDLSEILKIVTGSFDKIFDRPFPYMMVVHQNPINSPEYDGIENYFHLHFEFYTPLRSAKLIKYYASSESGAWAAANVAAVEKTAAEVRCAKLAFLAETDQELLKKEFLLEFSRLYGGNTASTKVIASPARINIIGEHIDYNGGKVFPCAIDKYIYIAIRKRNDRKVVYNDLRFPGERTFSIDDAFAYKKEDDYANYLNGILKIIKDRGQSFDSGFEILMFSTIPAGGGISSSSALEVGFAYAVSETYGFNLDRTTIALMGQQSEHEFMNVKCGIMDQFIIAHGKKDHAIVLDTNTLEFRHVPLDLKDYRIVVMNTNKKRQLADSKYNERRSECESGLAILQGHTDIKNLCDMSPTEFEQRATSLVDPVIRKRVKHCVYENDRVKKAVTALETGDLVKLGQLLRASHESLKNDYEVTGIELDTLFTEASKAQGCIGSRMTGAGFGGCAIAIVHKDSLKTFTTSVKSAYLEKNGYDASFFSCLPGDGVKEI